MFSIKNHFRLNEKALHYALLFFCALLPFQFALNPQSGIDLAIVRVLIPLLFIVWAVIKIKNKDYSMDSSLLSGLVAAFLFLAFISIPFSQNISWSFRKLLFLFSIAPLYFVVADVLKNKTNTAKPIIAALVAGSTLLAAIGIIQFFAQFLFGINTVYSFLAHKISPIFLGNSFSEAVLAYPSWLVNNQGATLMRSVAIFPDPHMLSYYMGLTIPWAIALATTSKKYKHWFFFSTALLVIADILTFTRGGYIALIAAAIATLPLIPKKAIKKMLLSVCLFLVLFAVAPHNPVSARFTSSFDVKEGSNQGRLSNWQQALLIIKKHPFGVGIGAYSLAVDPEADYRQPIYAHNLYLDIAAELGIFAALLFVAILLLALVSFWKVAKKQPFFIAGVGSMTVFSVHSLVETPLYSVHILPLFFMMLAISITAKNHELV